MKEKLELKHLAPYLPYGLKVRSKQEITYILNIFSNMRGKGLESRDIYSCLDNQYKPILRPLDLTKEIEHNGERFVPLYVLTSEILAGRMGINGYEVKYDLRMDFNSPRYCDVQKLLSWHFDVFGLIDKDLAISYEEVGL